MKFTFDLHHLVLYGLLVVVSLGGIEVFHSWQIDVVKARAKTDADQEVIQSAERSQAERAKQFESQVALIRSLRVTPKTPPAVIVTRLQGLEPEMRILPDQLVAPKPDAPKVNLLLEPAQQVTLVNRLVECKECDEERAKLRLDIGDEKTKRAAAEDQAKQWKDAAKGGSLWTRVKRRAWYFLEDVVAIEALRCAGGHC